MSITGLIQHNNIALDYGFTAGSYSGGPNGVNSPDYTSQNPHAPIHVPV